MNKSSEQIAADIEDKRHALHVNVAELRAKVSAFTDWRQQFERHPGMMLGVAIGAGAMLALARGRRARYRGEAVSTDAARRAPQSSEGRQKSVADQIWEPVKDMLIGVAVQRATEVFEQMLPASKVQPKASAVHETAPQRAVVATEAEHSVPLGNAAEHNRTRRREGDADEPVRSGQSKQAQRSFAAQETPNNTPVPRADHRTRME